MPFSLKNKDSNSKARTGMITTKSGIVETPVFMPVCTKGVPKTLTTNNLEDMLSGGEMVE